MRSLLLPPARLLATTLFATVVLGSTGARADVATEPATGQQFETRRTVEGRPFVLLGTGVRKKFMFKVYAMALYVDEVGARQAFPTLAARAGGRDQAHLAAGEQASSWVAAGHFSKIAVLHFVRNVDAEKIRETYQESLADALSDKAPADLRSAAQAFVALFDREMKSGQEIVLATHEDGRIEATIAGQKKTAPQSARLVNHIWSIWLGPHTISTDMRRSLVERIAGLGS